MTPRIEPGVLAMVVRNEGRNDGRVVEVLRWAKRGEVVPEVGGLLSEASWCVSGWLVHGDRPFVAHPQTPWYPGENPHYSVFEPSSLIPITPPASTTDTTTTAPADAVPA